MYNPYGFPAGYPQPGAQFGQFPGQFPAPVSAPGNYQAPQQPAAQSVGMPAVLQVSTIKQVEQAPVQPGGKALVLVANAPVIAMRTADNMGLTTTDYYRIERFDPEAAQAATTGDFVTRAELQQAIANLTAQLHQAAPAAVEKEAASK